MRRESYYGELMSPDIFTKVPKIEFHGNSTSDSRADTDGRTDMTKLKGATRRKRPQRHAIHTYIHTYIHTFHRSLRLSPDNRTWNMSKAYNTYEIITV